ncbi:MAG TPA: DinB family protein [Gemmatimonadales bacterium]|nr:DinB family protein [Gemmatimonadales bacterium]
MFDTGEPYARGELVAALRELEVAGMANLASMPGVEFFEAQGSAWSPAEHVRHLAKSARPVARALDVPRIVLAFRFGLHRGRSPSFADLRGRYLAQLAAGATAGRFTPTRRSLPGDLDVGRDATLSEWRDANRALEAALAGWAERSLDRYRLPHPVLGPLTLREMMMFTVYHSSHHLRRIAERRGGVPASAARDGRGIEAIALHSDTKRSAGT